MRQQGDHSTARCVPLSYKSTEANNQQVHAEKSGPSLNVSEHFLTQCEPLFCRAASKIALCFGIHPLVLLLFSFSPHSPSLCMLLAEDGDDGMGWIFNRFVSGGTTGGGIVVNIITYRSFRLHFPRPCQTGAITHSSQPHHTYAHTSFSHGWQWQCLSTPFHYVYLLWPL